MTLPARLPGLTVTGRCRELGWVVVSPLSGSLTALALGELGVGQRLGPGQSHARAVRQALQDAFLVVGHDAVEMLASVARDLARRGSGCVDALVLLSTSAGRAAPAVEAVGDPAPRVACEVDLTEGTSAWSLAVEHPAAVIRAVASAAGARVG